MTWFPDGKGKDMTLFIKYLHPGYLIILPDC